MKRRKVKNQGLRLAARQHTRGSPLRRRELLSLFSGAAFTWPLKARAQMPDIPMLGFLDSSVAIRAKLAAYYEGLRIEGFFRNQNVMFEYHSAEGNYDRLPALAADLVKRGVALIGTAGIPAALAAKAAITTIPIVFAAESDPLQVGLVTSLNRPGGNVTGIINADAAQEQRKLELLHELIPEATKFALLVNPTNPNAEVQTRDILGVAGKMGLQINVLHASADGDFDNVFATLSKLRPGGLSIGGDDFFLSRSTQLAALADRSMMPAIFQHREFVASGGLMSYGGDLTEIYHQAGVYSGLLLKGAKAADLPVYQSQKINFIVNLRSARLLRITFPIALLQGANEVLQ